MMLLLFLSYAASCLASCLPVALSQSGTSSPIMTSSQTASSSPTKTSSPIKTSSQSSTLSSSTTLSQSTTSSQNGSSVPTCAMTAYHVEVNGCTKHAATVTATSYTNCGGCTMTTDYLPGPAMMCMKMTTATDTTTTTALVCAPTPTCTKGVLPVFGSASSATCTSYISTTTQTVTTDCGGYPGCAVVTQAMGHGLAVKCESLVTSATSTAYATYCTS